MIPIAARPAIDAIAVDRPARIGVALDGTEIAYYVRRRNDKPDVVSLPTCVEEHEEIASLRLVGDGLDRGRLREPIDRRVTVPRGRETEHPSEVRFRLRVAPHQAPRHECPTPRNASREVESIHDAVEDVAAIGGRFLFSAIGASEGN